ncbi:MAG: succinyl-diaminopimelate desuccinylase [Alphaproteobacteria bacterium]
MSDFSRPFDVLKLSQALIQCPSITPHDAGALDVVEGAAKALGFDTHRLTFAEEGGDPVDNLFARLGNAADGPTFCFAGHTDVVPVGDDAAWTVDPFGGHVEAGKLLGRGAVDMKTAIAAFITATDRYIATNPLKGSIALLITGDEEGDAINGTRQILGWMRERGEDISHCLVGEPTNPKKLGEMMKVGRRGSFLCHLTMIGAQGHVAYPHLADNPVPRMAEAIKRLSGHLDEGTDHFDPSNLEFTSVDTGNAASNVIPAKVEARISIRFNDLHSGASLDKWIREELDKLIDDMGGAYQLETRISGESFLTQPGPFCDLVAAAIEETTGIKPDQSTTGGTSDARFITNMCPVCEFGMVGETMHKVDEHCEVNDLEALTDIYLGILTRYFEWAS